ncbi:MAG: peptidoglycan-binding protein, partial [Gammaproteobacteria bacterium]|nr:peptidoglycan-binding protein [Gammaproteobacteria bacterium]
PYEPFPYDLSFYPHAPEQVPDNARILAVTDHLQFGGRHDVVAISVGAREGVRNGQVYSIWNPGATVRDDIRHKHRMAANMKRNKVTLPDEFAGHVMIFRTFDKVSYGLVMDGIRPVQLDDVLKAPDRL